ncbi:MAG TPA: sigma-70 family RNA polymerase sigma factor [Planctomycetota bacterium]|nr:sigma-70 family RNA polymerase sigma factor [Planctomycetota bacterium]
MDPSEPDLIARARAGDAAAFDGLVRLHQARLRALAARCVLDADDAHDLVQEAFIDAWRHLDRFDATREFGPWLRTLCRNRVTSFLRARATRRTRPLALVDEALAARLERDDGGGDGDIAAVRTCLDELGERQRSLVDRRYARCEAVKDIARALGRTEGSVSMLLLRVRDALMRCVRRRTGVAT